MPWRLALAHLGAHPIRTFLTGGSVAVAIFLLCFLQTVVVGLKAGIEGSASRRLIVQSAVSLFVDLPLAYQTKIETVEGVAQTCKLQWFGGYYRDPSNFFAQFAVDHDRWFEAYPEVELIEGSEEAFLESPTACVLGVDVAEKYGFRVGDRVPIVGTIFPRLDGSPWEFEVAGIYRSKSSNVDQNTLWFHHEYLLRSIEAGDAGGPQGVGVYVLKVAPEADPIQISAKVDALYENGPQRVQTTTEAEFQRQFVTMLGSVPVFLSSIGGGILFAILFAALNTMLMSARQRTREFGILRALGFAEGTTVWLLLFESLLVSGLGGLAGVGFFVLAAPGLSKSLKTILPNFEASATVLGTGVGLALLLGLLAGALPAWLASRIEVVDALRREG